MNLMKIVEMLLNVIGVVKKIRLVMVMGSLFRVFIIEYVVDDVIWMYYVE